MILTGYEPKRYHKESMADQRGADGDTPRPSPFWSIEVQRQFMEATQSSHVARPSDLARHEQSEEQRLKEEQAEDQLQLEPPVWWGYRGSSHYGFGSRSAAFGFGRHFGGRVYEGSFIGSGPKSFGGQALNGAGQLPGEGGVWVKRVRLASKTVVSRSDHSRVPQHDNSESELVPDYAAAFERSCRAGIGPDYSSTDGDEPTDGATWWDDEQIHCGSGYSYAGAGVGATNASGCAVGSAGGGIHTGVS